MLAYLHIESWQTLAYWAAIVAACALWLWPVFRRGLLKRRNRRVLRAAEVAARKRWEGHRRE